MISTNDCKTILNEALFLLKAVQENEDDSAEIESTSEISELLGDKEHLYPKILYLVIADSAYSEGLFVYSEIYLEDVLKFCLNFWALNVSKHGMRSGGL